MNNPLSLVDPSGYTGAAPPDAGNAGQNAGGTTPQAQVNLSNLNVNDIKSIQQNADGSIDIVTKDGTSFQVNSISGMTNGSGQNVDANYTGGGWSVTTGSGTTGGGGTNVLKDDASSGQQGAASVKVTANSQTCNAVLPTDPNAALLSKTIFAEATISTRANPISPANSDIEMAAIGYSVVNRVDDLQDSSVPLSLYGATDRSMSGVVNASQYGSLNSGRFSLAANPSSISTADKVGRYNCATLERSIRTAEGVLNGSIKDPFAAQGGTYGMKTQNHQSPGDGFTKLPHITGSRNDFYTLSDSDP